jgi:glycosyltransferase involved in cell wall biosynthesis
MSMLESAPAPGAQPDVSLVMPCFNEEEIVGYTIRRLLAVFEQAGFRLEVVAVDNGSSDRTGEIIGELASRTPSVVPCRVEVNQGYGFGVLSGLPLATGRWVGWIPADSQVDAEDVLRLYGSVANTHGLVVAKVRRRFRMDGALRKLVTFCYNLAVHLLWPGMESYDVNAVPKMIPRQLLPLLELSSPGWALDPELMVKAHYMRLRVLEFNVLARARGTGLSHVRAATCWELFSSLLHFRFSRGMSRWRPELAATAVVEEAYARPSVRSLA